jgi:hypothetical protein
MALRETATNHGFAFLHRHAIGFTDNCLFTGGATGLEPTTFGVTGRRSLRKANNRNGV